DEINPAIYMTLVEELPTPKDESLIPTEDEQLRFIIEGEKLDKEEKEKVHKFFKEERHLFTNNIQGLGKFKPEKKAQEGSTIRKEESKEEWVSDQDSREDYQELLNQLAWESGRWSNDDEENEKNLDDIYSVEPSKWGEPINGIEFSNDKSDRDDDKPYEAKT
ncbi:16834_t:CDS:2, partial [Dentiscutata heterogama]